MSDPDIDDEPGEGGPGDDVATAGEYVLSLLPERDRAVFERRLLGEPALRALVAEWERHLAALVETVPEIRPPARLRRDIERRLFPKRRPGRLGLLAGLLTGAAVSVAALVGYDLLLAPVLPIEAELAAEDGTPVLAAVFDPEEQTITAQLLLDGAPEGRVIQLWLLPEGAETPSSVGLFPTDVAAGDAVSFAVDPDLAPDVPGALIEISEEPPGGSQDPGGPSGEVLGIGRVPER